MKYLDKDGLLYLWGKIKAKIPTKTSDLTNDSGYLTSHLTAGRSINITNNAINNIGVTDVSVSPNEAGNGTVAVTRGTATGTQTSYIKVKGINNGAYKNIDNTISAGSSSANLPTSSAVASFVEGKGYIASEIDPVFSASASAGITSNDIDNWDGKQDALVSGTNIKTINNNSLLGSGNLDIGSEKLPIGSIKLYAGSTAPDGYLFCNGQAVSRTTYSDLFAVIGTTYGAGDGSTTFNLPNLKGRVAVGLDSDDTDFDTLGNTGGEKEHTLTAGELPKLSGDAQVKPYDSYTTSGIISRKNWSQTKNITTAAGNHNETTLWGFQINFGNDEPHNILQPYITLNYIIKASDSSMATLLEAEVHDGYNTSTIDAYSCNYVNTHYSENLPIGTEVDYIGTTVPSGWQQVDDYSTSEINTGKLWIDNKPIYRKVIDFGALPNSTSKNFAHNISVDTVIKCYGVVYRTSPYARWTIPTDNIYIYCNLENIIIQTTSNRTDCTAKVILEYTKTTD